MPSIAYEEDIQQLSEKYSELTAYEIQYLQQEAARLLGSDQFEEFDMFIDIRNAYTGEAIVVSHRPPLSGKSIYKERVVGKVAYRKDEPGPLRTLDTSQNSTELFARSQEGLLIKQTAYPIKCRNRTIAVLILEQDLSDDIKANFQVTSRDCSYNEVSEVIEEVEIIDQSITNYIDDAILIFDQNGYLRYHNKAAHQYYENFGYLNPIDGLHYDNLALDLTTFEDILTFVNRGEYQALEPKEIKFGRYYFKSKTIYLPTKEIVIQIMQDITDQKVSESRFISELVTIQEIHHRVKNNLQTVVSLLRLQARRAESPEAKKVLNESVNRVLSIAATHELLSKQKEDDVQLKLVLDAVILNLSRFYQDSMDVTLKSSIDPSIVLDSNKAVTVALITNELIQNCYDHAFQEKEEGTGSIQVEINQVADMIQMVIEDNGTGFNVDDSTKHNLGLQIVISFVESKLQGAIVIDSSPHGTKIRIGFQN